MSPLSDSTIVSRPIARSFAIAALLGATMLVTPLTVARADGTGSASIHHAQAVAPRADAAPATARTKAGTVEQRITDLHAALKITATEESDWSAVAQAMRDNAAAMQRLVAEKVAHAPGDMTAVESLNVYVKFAQAHVAGLKNLTSSFDTLYQSMPDAQKKIADQVFANSRHKDARSRS